MMSSIQTLRQHLEIFQQTFSNALTPSSPRLQQPPHLLSELRPHQKALTAKMSFLESKLRSGLTIDNEVLFSNHGFLGDSTGTGRTMSVLSHISNKAINTLHELIEPQTPPVTLHHSSSPACFSLSNKQHAIEHTFDNLIVVSHTLFRQWQDTILNNTSLNAYFIKTVRNLDTDDLVELLRRNHLTLISNSLLHSLLNNLEARNVKPLWRRVFFDEADTIKIQSSCKQVPSLFTWFIAGNYQNILFSNECYHSYITRQLPREFIDSLSPDLRDSIVENIRAHPTTVFFRTTSHSYFINYIKNSHPLRGHLVIKCTSEFLQESIQFPELRREVIRCLTPSRQALVENALPEPVVQILHAGDISGALVALGVSTHTPITLVDAVTNYAKEQLSNNRALLEQVLLEGMPESDSTIEKLKEVIQKMEDEIINIQNRLGNVSTDDCAICFENPENRCITPCCSRSFCASCILEWMTRVPSCPLCRKTFHPNQLITIGDECNIVERQPIEQTPRLLKKHEALIKIFRENPTGRFIVFSRYDNPFGHLSSRVMRDYNIAFLQGNKDAIANILSDFNEGFVNVLFINSNSSIAGLNIPTASHIIFWHRMSEESQKNVLGTAYCVGRQTPLHCISLLHERE
jgi:hypothetical protein